MTLVKFDWDNLAFFRMEKRLVGLKNEPSLKEIIVFESPKMNGYHIQAISKWRLTYKEIFLMRLNFHDDPKRLSRDAIGVGQNLLFSYKVEKKFGREYLWYSTYLFKLKRNEDNTWHKNQKLRNFQISTPKQSERLQVLSQSLPTSYAVQELSNV